ncbi:toprim domain-containing protein [Vibrio mediterranei]|uniref:toprim domain-containing protein n=1 Tax=Vibrio mediterranei TaxID=689 RepID=UPI0040682916
MNMKLQEERRIVDGLVAQVGWLRILRDLTPLTVAVDNYTGQHTGSPSMCDVCPDADHPNHKFHLLPDADERGMGRCWVCGEVKDPYEIIGDFNGVNFGEAYRMVKAYVGYERGKDYQLPRFEPRREAQVKEPTEAELARYAAQRKKMALLWEESFPVDAPEAEPLRLYLRNRGVGSIPLSTSTVGFHPRVKYYTSIDNPNKMANFTQELQVKREELITLAESHPYFQGFNFDGDVIVGADMGFHPCVTLVMRDKYFNARRVLKVYIDEDGRKLGLPKHPGFPIKKVQFASGPDSSFSGCGIYLEQPTNMLMIAEGFETVAVGRTYVNIPAASTFNSSGIGSFDVPDGVKLVFHLVDKDRSRAGDKAAFRLMERYMGSDVIVIPVFIPIEIPENDDGIDWADVLNQAGGEQHLPHWLLQPDTFHDWLGLRDHYWSWLSQEKEDGWQWL